MHRISPASRTHHQDIGVDFVHLGEEEAEQSPLCASDLHFTVLTKDESKATLLSISKYVCTQKDRITASHSPEV